MESEGQPVNELVHVQRSFEVFLDKSQKPTERKLLIQSGIDFVFYLQADFYESVRRCFGRRLHPQSFRVFHLEDNLPNKKFYVENKTENKISNSINNSGDLNSVCSNIASNNLSAVNYLTKNDSSVKVLNYNNNYSIAAGVGAVSVKKNLLLEKGSNNERLMNASETEQYTFHINKYNNDNSHQNNSYKSNLIAEENNRTFENSFLNSKKANMSDTVLVGREDLICENFMSFESFSLAEAQFAVRYLSFENNLPHIAEFYEDFGFEKEGEKLFQIFQASSNRRVLSEELIEKINILSDINEKKYEVILQKYNLDNFNFNNDNSNSNSKIICELPLLQHQNAAFKNEISLFNPLQNNNSVENNVNLNENLNQYNNNNNNFNNKLDNRNKENDTAENDFQQIKKEVEDIEAIKLLEKSNYIKSNLNSDIADILFVIWKKTYENYSSGLKMIFKSLRNQRDSIANYYNMLSQKFIDFLKRPSNKQKFVLEYQVNFNTFVDEFPDLVDKLEVKEEFHQNVEDLFEKIMEINENRRVEAIEERRKIMNSNWIETEMEKFYINLEYLFQLEADKFLGTLQIINDFYACLSKQLLFENPMFSYDVLKEEPVIYFDLFYVCFF